MGVDGAITVMEQLIQLATLYDNAGKYEEVDNFGDLVHEGTRHSVNSAFPRLGRCSWFRRARRGEIRNKPWCHTAHIPQFDNDGREHASPALGIEIVKARLGSSRRGYHWYLKSANGQKTLSLCSPLSTPL